MTERELAEIEKRWTVNDPALRAMFSVPYKDIAALIAEVRRLMGVESMLLNDIMAAQDENENMQAKLDAVPVDDIALVACVLNAMRVGPHRLHIDYEAAIVENWLREIGKVGQNGIHCPPSRRVETHLIIQGEAMMNRIDILHYVANELTAMTEDGDKQFPANWEGKDIEQYRQELDVIFCQIRAEIDYLKYSQEYKDRQVRLARQAVNAKMECSQ